MTLRDETHDRRLKRINEDLDFMSKQVSDLSRYIAFGLAAFTLAILTSSSKFATMAFEKAGSVILVCSFLGCLSIVFDYLQYLAGYKASQAALRNKEQNYVYQKDSVWLQGRYLFFYLKQVAAFAGAALFAGTVFVLALPF